MNPTSETLACWPFGHSGELTHSSIGEAGGRMGGEQREGQRFPLFNQSLESEVWRVSRVGNVPREESGGGDRWMRSTSGNVRGTRERAREERAGEKSRLGAGWGTAPGWGWEAVKRNPSPCFSPHPPLSRHKMRTQAPRSSQPWIIWG